MSEMTWRELNEHAQRLEALEAQGWPRVQYCMDNVSDPPTDAELDTAFGTPATVGAGFIGIVDDNGFGIDFWLCSTNGVSWFYVQLTIAV